MQHVPVLLQEVLAALRPHAGGRYVDATVGLGGHAREVLAASVPDGELLGIDLDPYALQIARVRLESFGGRAHLVHGASSALQAEARELGWKQVDGILMDLGLSSLQLDLGERGFSFQVEAPLDMRFDPQAALTAAEIVNVWPEQELADLIREFGEEPHSWRVAREIVKARPVETTTRLAAVVAAAVGRQPGRIHPATRTFQAVRMAVNGELDLLASALPQALEMLAVGGRLAVISFHSLEDRLVKDTFRQAALDCVCPPAQPVCNCDKRATVRLVTRRPIVPADAEVAANKRSRSAKMRVVEKLGD